MYYLSVAKNTLYQFVARLSSAFVGFLITIIIARYFGVFGFGEYIKITSYVTLFYLVLDFGLNAVFLNTEKQDYKSFFYLRVLISLVLLLVINLIVFVLPYNQQAQSGFSNVEKLGVLIFSLTIISQGIIYNSLAIFQKKLKFNLYTKGIIFGSLINLAVVFTFAFLNYSIFYVLFAFVLSSTITALLHIKDAKENIFPIKVDFKYAKEIFLLSLPIGLMLVFNLVYFRADIFLLSLLSTTKSVGIYGIAYKFFDFIIAVPLFLSNSIYPILIKYKNEEVQFNKLVIKYFLIFLCLSLFLIMAFWFSSPLFNLISSGFLTAVLPFRILLVSLPFFFTTSFLQWILISKSKQKFLMYTYLFLLIFNIMLNVVFIPKYSYVASAWITVLSEGLVFIILMLKTIRVLNFTRTGVKKYE